MTCPITLLCRIEEQRMKRTFARSGLVSLSVIVGAISLEGLARAGQQNTASIVGQVKDESGAVLPGVTVTTKSPALQVPEIATVTDERGEYRLSPLPPGSYSV